jgi:hypothetical protein
MSGKLNKTNQQVDWAFSASMLIAKNADDDPAGTSVPLFEACLVIQNIESKTLPLLNNISVADAGRRRAGKDVDYSSGCS